VQIDGLKGHMFINFQDDERMKDVLHSTGEQVECPRTNSEISNVQINTPGMGMRRVRIASLPLEASDRVLLTVLFRCGKVNDIQAETWSRLYRYALASLRSDYSSQTYLFAFK
jgi:hypothetical protein